MQVKRTQLSHGSTNFLRIMFYHLQHTFMSITIHVILSECNVLSKTRYFLKFNVQTDSPLNIVNESATVLERSNLNQRNLNYFKE